MMIELKRGYLCGEAWNQVGRSKREKLCEVNTFYILLTYVEVTRVCRYVCMDKFIELYTIQNTMGKFCEGEVLGKWDVSYTAAGRVNWDSFYDRYLAVSYQYYEYMSLTQQIHLQEPTFRNICTCKIYVQGNKGNFFLVKN